MQEVLPELAIWKERGDRIALATVIDVQRSAPRPPGAKMAVNDTARSPGRCPGGCVEGAVVEIADGVLRGDPPQLLHFGIADSDAWDVGLPCGGEIDVWVQAYEPGRFEEIARAGGRAAEVTLLEGAVPGAKLLVEADGARSGSLGAPELDDEAARMADELLWAETSERRGALFIDVVGPAPRLILFGAVDIAASLCSLARAAGWRPYVVDPRARFATPRAVPRRRGGDRGVAGGGVRAARRDRSGDVDRGAHPRPEARRRGAGDRAALAGAVHRRDGLAARPGQAARAAARSWAWARRSWSACPRRSASTSARSAARRPRCRSWPRSSPPAMGATAGGSPTRKGRIHEVPA